MAATNKSLAESDKSGRRGNAKYSRTAREPLAAQTKHERIPMFRTLMIGAVSALALSTAAFAQQGGSGYARQGGRRRKGGPGRGASDVPQGRGRVPGPRSLSILFQNRGREAPRQSEGCSSWHGH